ncbi:MAG TPA: chemotaxis-specific protein-glutamate methyltransferase CheB [Rhodobacterales bacterium]|nr:chemotaxis-specific protein-glutamate methyltransferase CheB [Rhodobacterales bacterium]
MTQAARVLIVDDSATMRRLIRTGIANDPRFEVVGEAADAREARDAVKALAPDVLTLDVEMPGMSGLEFLERLMRARPTPVIMFSSLTAKGSEAALSALSLGAVDCLEKPRFGSTEAAFARLKNRLSVAASAQVGPARGRAFVKAGRAFSNWQWNRKWVLIGSSTGGVEALETVLGSYPPNGPPTLVTQHMPAPFLASFAARLDATMRPKVRLAQDGDRPAQGEVFIAPGGETHLVLDEDGQTLRLLKAAKRTGHRPSVDMMFGSAVAHASRMVAVMLTGMGRDGAQEMKALRDHGASCVGQDRASAVVYGMPRVAQEMGAIEAQFPLEDIGPEILKRTGKQMDE